MHKKKWEKIASLEVAIVCPYCLKPIPPENLSIEHEPPKSRQDEFGPSKKVWACKKCNNEKGALTAEEYKLWKELNKIRCGVKQR